MAAGNQSDIAAFRIFVGKPPFARRGSVFPARDALRLEAQRYVVERGHPRDKAVLPPP